MLFLGQNDLCMSMGLFEKYVFPEMYTSKELMGATDKLIKAAKKNKVILGLFLFGTSRVGEFLEKGFRFISVGNDLHQLAAELDKCASYALGAQAAGGHSGATHPTALIDAEAVSAVVGVRRGETVTDLLDAVARQDAPAAMALVGHVLGQPKVTAVQVVMMMSTQAFALAFGRARRDAGIPTPMLPKEYFAFLKETGGYPGRPWGEAASAWTKVTDQWSAAACERALALLLEADIALKENTVSTGEQIMMTLVLSLCALRGRRRSAA